MKKLIIIICILVQSHVAFGFLCKEAFDLSAARPKSLTQVYIHRNATFPLHSTLIQSALAADIVLNRITETSPLDYRALSRALNSLHKKHQIPVRVEVEGQIHEPGIRYLKSKDLVRVTEPMLYVTFKSLKEWGFLGRELTARELLFWQEVKNYFDSTNVKKQSLAYRQVIGQRGILSPHFLQIKYDSFTSLVEGLFFHLEQNMPGGLSNKERSFLGSSSIFK